jgi:tight adherence protein C
MSLEFLFSILFGLGTAGLFAQARAKPAMSLVNRVGTSVTRIAIKPERFALAKSLARIRLALRSQNSSKIEKALFELPEIIEILVVCLRSGQGVFQSLEKVVSRATGELSKELEKILMAVSFGAALATEMNKLPESLPHPQFAEFANKISLSLNRGTPLSQMLQDQGKSARAETRNRLLRQAGKNETKMLIPLVFLILPITVLFAIYPSLKLLNFGFI